MPYTSRPPYAAMLPPEKSERYYAAIRIDPNTEESEIIITIRIQSFKMNM